MASPLANLPIFRWHDRSVYVPRRERLVKAIVDLVPRASSLLDIGCGDGSMATMVAKEVGASGDLHGVDVLIRPNVAIDVRHYDGRVLPFEDGRFELVTICDVIHHAEDPNAVLTEAMRVLAPRGHLVIKDHFRLGTWSNAVLTAMDVFGNYAAGVLVRGQYKSPTEWVDAVSAAGGRIDKLVWPFVVHDLPWRWVARSEYQFLMRIERAPV